MSIWALQVSRRFCLNIHTVNKQIELLYLLHDLIFSNEGSVLEVLRIRCSTNELLISTPLILTARFTQLPVCVDLVLQVLSQELLLSLLSLQIDLNLIKSLFWAKVRLIVKMLKLVLRSFPLLLFSDLVLNEFPVGSVLVLAILLLEVLHAVHVVQRRVELMLLSFTRLLHTIDLVVEPLQGLLVYLANRVERVVTFVNSVVVNCERSLRAHKFRNRRVVVFRDFFAIQGHLYVRKLVQNASGGLLRLLADLIAIFLNHVELEA